MKTFRQYLREYVLLENKAWHQFIGQFGRKIMDKMHPGTAEVYDKLNQENPDPKHGSPEHMTNYISHHMGLGELTADEGKWVLKHFHGGGIAHQEDIKSTVIPNLMKLRSLKERGVSTANLGKIKGAAELFGHVSKHDPDTSLIGHEVDPKEYTKVGENEHWHVYTPHTKEAACALGRATNWCTAATGRNNMFDHYDGHKNPLHVLIPKNPKYNGEKYQHFVGTDENGEEQYQFMDKADVPIWQGTSSDSRGPDFASRPLPELTTKFRRHENHTQGEIDFHKNHPEHFATAVKDHMEAVDLNNKLLQRRTQEDYWGSYAPRASKTLSKEQVDHYVYNVIPRANFALPDALSHAIGSNRHFTDDHVDSLIKHIRSSNKDPNVPPNHRYHVYDLFNKTLQRSGNTQTQVHNRLADIMAEPDATAYINLHHGDIQLSPKVATQVAKTGLDLYNSGSHRSDAILSAITHKGNTIDVDHLISHPAFHAKWKETGLGSANSEGWHHNVLRNYDLTPDQLRKIYNMGNLSANGSIFRSHSNFENIPTDIIDHAMTHPVLSHGVFNNVFLPYERGRVHRKGITADHISAYLSKSPNEHMGGLYVQITPGLRNREVLAAELDRIDKTASHSGIKSKLYIGDLLPKYETALKHPKSTREHLDQFIKSVSQIPTYDSDKESPQEAEHRVMRTADVIAKSRHSTTEDIQKLFHANVGHFANEDSMKKSLEKYMDKHKFRKWGTDI